MIKTIKQLPSQNGFGLAGVVLVIVIVGLVSSAGLLVYRHSRTAVVTPVLSHATSPTSATAQKTFSIHEWNVEAAYSGSDTYTYRLSADGKMASVGSKRLAAIDASCVNDGAGTIARYAPNDPSPSSDTNQTIAEQAEQTPGLYVLVGGYYYQFMHAQAACGTVSITDQNQANDQVKNLVMNFKPVTN